MESFTLDDLDLWIIKNPRWVGRMLPESAFVRCKLCMVTVIRCVITDFVNLGFPRPIEKNNRIIEG